MTDSLTEQMVTQRRIATDTFAALRNADKGQRELIDAARQTADRIIELDPTIGSDALAVFILQGISGPKRDDPGFTAACDLQRYVMGLFGLLLRQGDLQRAPDDASDIT